MDRGSPAVLIARGGERILVDCGEGTQRQLMRSVGLARIGTIAITHLHGDHYLGLPGLLKTLSLAGREEPLQLFGPPGLYELLREVERIVGRNRVLRVGRADGHLIPPDQILDAIREGPSSTSRRRVPISR